MTAPERDDAAQVVLTGLGAGLAYAAAELALRVTRRRWQVGVAPEGLARLRAAARTLGAAP